VLFWLWDHCDRNVLKQVRWEFFAPKHGKGIVDSTFGLINRTMEQKYKEKEHRLVSEVMQTLSDFAHDQKVMHPDAAEYIFAEFVPMPRNQYDWKYFTQASMMGMQHAYSWQFVYLDSRRLRLNGRAHNWAKVTGVEARNSVLTGHTADPSMKCTPTLDPSKGDDENDGDYDAEDPVQISLVCKNHMGWRTSFCADNSGKHVLRTRHLAKGKERLPVTDQAEPVRHRAPEVLQQHQKDSAEVQAKRKKESRDHVARMRELLE
jgi:hypothetical protein